MYRLKTAECFDAAHFLKDYNGKCANIHGHRWKVEVEIACEALNENGSEKGMCVDFSVLKADLKKMLDEFDHTLIIEKDSLKAKTLEALAEENFKIVTVDFRPTAENFSKFFYDEMEKLGYDVAKIVVFETPNNCAIYEKQI